MKKIAIVLFFIAGTSGALRAQVDPHFSQYYVYPSWLNPGLTGAFDGDYRISGIYRSQWGNIGNGFKTEGLSADMVTNKNLNLGASIMQQQAGTGGYTYTTGYASIAYTGAKFDVAGYKRLVIGMQVGFITRKFDPTKFTLGDQWLPTNGYNPSNGSPEVFIKNSSTVFDIGAGAVYYDADPRKKANIFLGFAAAHLSQPEDGFTAATKTKLPMRFNAHGGVKLAVSDQVSITPNALYTWQAQSHETMVGAYVQLKASEFLDVLVGANYRVKDAVVPFAGLDYKNLVIGVSYDVNNSDLGKSITQVNSFEISLSYIIRKTRLMGEKFFTCPRL